MFTGLIACVGEVTGRAPEGGGVRLEFSAPGRLTESLADGDSVAVDGVCLTVTGRRSEGFCADAVSTTLGRTTLGEFAPGRAVNLEAAVRAGEPLGGHLVQGHEDGVGDVVEVASDGDGRLLRIRLPDEVGRFTVERGSLTVDGVSLTVSGLAGEVAKLAIIPYTLGHTNLGRLEAGSRVNLEADLIGKYVVRLLDPYRSGRGNRPDPDNT
jgi:riboflavin synthase